MKKIIAITLVAALMASQVGAWELTTNEGYTVTDHYKVRVDTDNIESQEDVAYNLHNLRVDIGGEEITPIGYTEWDYEDEYFTIRVYVEDAARLHVAEDIYEDSNGGTIEREGVHKYIFEGGDYDDDWYELVVAGDTGVEARELIWDLMSAAQDCLNALGECNGYDFSQWVVCGGFGGITGDVQDWTIGEFPEPEPIEEPEPDIPEEPEPIVITKPDPEPEEDPEPTILVTVTHIKTDEETHEPIEKETVTIEVEKTITGVNFRVIRGIREYFMRRSAYLRNIVRKGVLDDRHW